MKDLINLLKLTRAHRIEYSVAIAALLFGASSYLLIPAQFGKLMGALHHVAAGHKDDAAKDAVLALAGLLAFQAAAGLLHGFLVGLGSERIINGLRAKFFRNIVDQRLDEVAPKALGKIASEFSSDLSLIQDGLSTTLLDCIRNILVSVGSLAGLLFIHYKMTMFALVGVGSVAGVISLFIRRATSSVVAIQQYRASVMTLLLEGAANAYIIQAYGRQSYMDTRFTAWLNGTFARVRGYMLLMACMNPVCLIVFSGVMTGLAMYGMRELTSGHLTVEQLVSYFTFAVIMITSVSQVGYTTARLRQAAMILVKHQHMLAEVPKRKTEARAIRSFPTKQPRGFALRNVTFTYPGKDSAAVSDISFVIPPGQVTAVVGESGAGKSTIAALLCGVYRPQIGSVRLLEKDGASAELHATTQEIAIVPQEPFLFAGSILENITFGREQVSREQALRAAERARIDDFIMSLPGGYETTIEEAGKNLSRGQRQRLAIARALAGKPEVLIFDEATASLDVVSERAIKALVDELRGSVTFIIIAHQGALLTGVDRMVVLRCGELVFEGQPAEFENEMGGVLCS